MIPSWLEEKKENAKQLLQEQPKIALNYGLTIRLDSKRVDLAQPEHSEQIITIEHENAEVSNLFDNLEQVSDLLLSTKPAMATPATHYTETYFDMGLLITIPKGQTATINLTRTLTSKQFVEHILIVAEENSTATIIDRHTSENCELKASTVEIIARNNAHVRFASIQALKQDCVDLTSYRSQVKDSAKVDWFIASLGSTLTHANVDTHLQGVRSTARSYGVFLGDKNQNIDVSASTFHTGDNSYSDMYTRGVLLDEAKAVYRGNIDIASEAFDCNGYQTEETILVGEKAVADAIPNLEIRNNQVKCSHGATIGRVDEEQLFYLQSRGINREEAVKMIIEGFFEPLTAKLEWPELFPMIQPLIHEKLE